MFAYTTVLNHLLEPHSRNKFMVGSRTFLFWASKSDEALRVIDCSNAEGGMDTPEGIFARIEEVVAPLLNNL